MECSSGAGSCSRECLVCEDCVVCANIQVAQSYEAWLQGDSGQCCDASLVPLRVSRVHPAMPPKKKAPKKSKKTKAKAKAAAKDKEQPKCPRSGDYAIADGYSFEPFESWLIDYSKL